MCLIAHAQSSAASSLAATCLYHVRKTARPSRKPRVALPGERPLRLASGADIAQQWQRALRESDGISGAHCIHELWMRGEVPVRIQQALDTLWQHAAASIPEWLPTRYIHWLPTAYEVAMRFQAARRGRTNIYLVLLDYSDRGAGEYGVYVGMTHYSPAARFDQHKAGLRAAGSVLKRGLEVVSGPVLHLQRISRADAAHIEVALAEALSATGLNVQGGH